MHVSGDMLSRLHPFTVLGILLSCCALPVWWTGHVLFALILLVLAYGAVAIEFKTHTSHLQFSSMVAIALLMGILLDRYTVQWPLFTVALVLAAVATVARQAFMQQFTYVNLLWLDTGLALVAGGVYAVTVSTAPVDLVAALPPLLPIGAALFLTTTYVFDALRMSTRTRFGYRVKVGEVAPDFQLPDQNGTLVRLSDYRGRHPVLLIFVRGDWCPGCHMMLRTYERNRSKFLDRGIHVLAVGPDNIDVNRAMVERIGVHYRMLSDDAQRASGMYGVVYNNPMLEISVNYEEGIPLPASFLVDTNGVVRYVSRPDRVGEFLDPSLIFGVLDELPPATHLAWS
ncbi:MAG: redoxin domain-containing protein [Flavobacteriales bacterium]